MLSDKGFKSCLTKKILEGVLQESKPFLSEVSPFIHYVDGVKKAHQRDAITTSLNFFYALALVKTHQQEKVLEAKALINKLCCFQIVDEGSVQGAYPLFLHQFPFSYSKSANLDILLVQALLLKHYEAIFKKEEKVALKKSIQNQLTYFNELFKEERLDSLLVLKLYYCLSILKGFFEPNLEDLFLEIEKKINDLELSLELLEEEALGELLIFALIEEKNLEDHPLLFQKIYKKINALWDPNLLCFTGPATRRSFQGNRGVESLFSLVMSLLSEKENLRSELLFPLAALLKAVALFPPAFKALANFDRMKKINLNSHSWGSFSSLHLPEVALSYQEFPEKQRYKEKTFYPLKLDYIADNENSLMGNLAIQSEFVLRELVVKDKTLTFQVLVDESIGDVDPHLPVFSLYFSKQKESSILISGARATCFTLNDDIILKSKTQLFKVCFHCKHESNKFLGHVKLGNRKGQKEGEELALREAHDWHLYLRSLGLKPGVEITVTIEL
ncbi:hypothetical protein AB751O23_AH_00140 [Chlamydiales bacterium SCGC AB-751-O23]|nr:hypothetical protein AB751O23_AH_00140 [Chlamydiales bacterium SCGC AB-751-O23]